MAEWVKIKSGDTTARMLNREWPNYVELSFADVRPAGFYPVEKILPKPVPAEGEELGYIYELVGDVMRKTYFVEAPPRVFSKYRLVSALMQANLWAGVKAWIENTEGAYDLYLAAEDISEDEPLLAQGVAALKSELGVTDEQIESVLAAAAL